MNAALRIVLLFVAALSFGTAFSAEKADFSGHWLDCEPYRGVTVCSGYVLEQKGDHVCAVGSAFATSRQYEDSLKGEAHDGLFVATSACGSGTRHDCPKFSPVTNRGLLLCGNRLYETGGRHLFCEEASRKKALRPYRKVNALEFERHLGKLDLLACRNAL